MSEESLRQAMSRRLMRQTVASGTIRLPAAPSLIDDYVSMCDGIFSALGCNFNADELARLREVLAGQLAAAYEKTQRSHIVITYDTPVGTRLNYFVKAEWSTIDALYNEWVATREPPLFGTEPDARVVELAGAADDPSTFPILDIGAGTGRNTLALARRGHPVDAVEMTTRFADIIRADAARDSLTVRVIERDVFGKADDLRTDYQLILLSEVVSDFRSTDQLRGVFDVAERCLAPGGQLVFNVFLNRGDYVPDGGARELGQQFYTTIFTYDEVAAAAASGPLELISDDSVYEFEQANLPPGTWPQTSWYPNWISGLDVFELAREDRPIEMRWLVYRKPQLPNDPPVPRKRVMRRTRPFSQKGRAAQ